MKNVLDTIAICTGAVVSFMWGELDGLMIALIAFVTVDYITGLVGAFITHTANSTVGWNGICKKLVTVLVVAVAHILDEQVVHAGGILRNAIICYFIANEGLSLLENAGKMGLPIPQKLLDVLEQLKADGKKSVTPAAKDDEEDKDNGDKD